MRRFLFLQLLVGFVLLFAGCDDASTRKPNDLMEVSADVAQGDSVEVDLEIADALDVAPDEVDVVPDDLLDGDGVSAPDEIEELDAADVADPNRPLKNLEDLREGTLRTALFELVRDHTALGYDVARDEMYAVDFGIDVHDGYVECIYTGTQAPADGTNTMGGSFNTEHSWPQSAGAADEPAHSDMHHLFPVLDSANIARSNNPFGVTDCDIDGSCLWELGGSALGPSFGSGMRVFEVRSVRSGDIARAQFYFSLRYQMEISGEVEATLRDWNRSDPPDNRERVRNDRIEALQGNRNPFIDRSDFVDFISDF